MKLKSFVKFLIDEDVKPEDIYEGFKHNAKAGVHIYEPPAIKKGGDYPNLPNALNHNGKNMFYSFDLTNICDRGCPGCYVARGVEISCNGVSKIGVKEYKGDLKKWQEQYNIAKDIIAGKGNIKDFKIRGTDANGGSMSPDEYIKALDAAKEQINANGGIRMFSAADYPNTSSEFYKEIMNHYHISDPNYFKDQVERFLNDAHDTGWHVKAITKEKNFLTDKITHNGQEKHIIDHPALKGVDISMNSQGFGEPHESVKALKKGKHQAYTPKVNKVLKDNSHKIIGRTVTHTPFDLKTILDHKKDDGHIGVITSGHDIPGSGIRFSSSVPKDPHSPKTIFIQTNFPKELMSILDGSLILESEEESTPSDKNIIRVTLIKNNETGKWEQHTHNVSQTKVGSKYKDTDITNTDVKTHIGKPNEKHEVEKVSEIVVPDLEEDFDRRNPPFHYTFSNDDAAYLMTKMEGKMCCAGEKDGEASYGKCHNCNAKCGVAGATKGGSCKPISDASKTKVAGLLNEYADKYNKLVESAKKQLQAGSIVVNEIKDSKGVVPDVRDISKGFDKKEAPVSDVEESVKNKFIKLL